MVRLHSDWVKEINQYRKEFCAAPIGADLLNAIIIEAVQKG